MWWSLLKAPRSRTPRRRPFRSPAVGFVPTLENLENRLALAVALGYAGPGSTLVLSESVSGATQAVGITEPSPGQLVISLYALPFAPSSAVSVPGLTYSAGSPGSSQHATIDIGTANNVSQILAFLPGDDLFLGPIADAHGGLGNINASAGAISVDGVNLAQAGPGNGNLTLLASGALTVTTNSTIDTGTGTISLAADVNADGSGNNGQGALAIQAGAVVTTLNLSSSAITLRGANIAIDSSAHPALVGARWGLSSTATPFANVNIGGAGFSGRMAFDQNGDLFVAGFSDDSVYEIPAGSNVATAFVRGIHEPLDLAFDSNGNLFATDYGHDLTFGDTQPDLSEVAQGSNTVVPIFNGGLVEPYGLAIDSQNNVFVSEYSVNGPEYQIDEVRAGTTTPVLFATTGLNSPSDMAFDATGNLFVLGSTQDRTTPIISKVAAGSNIATPWVTTGLNSPSGLAVDGQGNLFVGDGSVVKEVPAGSTVPIPVVSLSLGSDSVMGLAFDKSGALYVNTVHGAIYKVPIVPIPQAVGVVIRPSLSSQPMNLGGSSVGALNLSNAELAQVFTTGTLTFGDSSQTGTIAFHHATPAGAPGTAIVVQQALTGTGQIVLDDQGTGVAVNGKTANVTMTAGLGGFVVTNGGKAAAVIATTGAITLNTDASTNFTVGISAPAVVFGQPATVTVNVAAIAGMPAGTVSLSVDGGKAGSQPLSNGAAVFTLTNLSGGTHTLDARYTTQDGHTTVSASGPLDAAASPPAITSADHATFTAGTTGSFTVTTTGSPSPSLDDGGYTLPAGLSLFDNEDGTAILSGTPAPGTGGSYAFTITADNGNGLPASQPFTLTVGAAPAITSAASAVFSVGSAGSFSVAASGFPAPTWSESPSDVLPAGVTFDPTTGLLSGTPARGTAGTYSLNFTAANGFGVAASQTFSLTINPIRITEPGTLPASASPFGNYPTGITAGPDGNLWFTEYFGNNIGNITPAGTITEYPLPSAYSYPNDITAGPDGNLWFTEYGSNKIGRITPAGTITEFPIDLSASSTGPWGITAGPDGNLWFTESSTNMIGRITPAGAITEFSGLSPDSYPTGITAGPDGNLWFTEAVASQVGRITTSGVVQEFSNGITANSAPSGITAGPDGNLWFTEINGDQIGRITTSGVVQEFGAGITPGSQPTGITAGPDGNLWFTEGGEKRIGRITPAGTVTEFSTGFADYPSGGGITAGPDGNLWFTETDNNRIGEVAGLTGVSISAPPVSFGSVAGVTVTVTSDAGLPNGAVTLYVDGALFLDGAAGSPMAVSGNTAVFQLSGLAAGVHTLTAVYGGSDFTAAAEPATLFVTQAPTISSFAAANFTPGTAGSFTVTASGFPAPTLSESGPLPTGVSFTDNGDGTATLSGTPAAGTDGLYPFLITASNDTGTDATQAFTLTNQVTLTAPTLSVTDAGGPYNGAPFAATATVAGVVPGVDTTPAATLENVPVTLDYQQLDTLGNVTSDLGTQAPTTAGFYQVVASFAGSTDYTPATDWAVFTIDPASPTVSVTDAGGTYKGAPFAATATVAGVVPGVDTTPAATLENVPVALDYQQLNALGNVTNDLGVQAPAAPGTYQVVASFAGSTDYGPATDWTLFTIAQATPTVSVADFGGTYNGKAFPATMATVAGVVPGVDTSPAPGLEGKPVTLDYQQLDALGNVSGDLGTQAPTTAGNYQVTASFAGSPDYTAATSTATPFTINQARPVVLVLAGGGTYNGKPFPATAFVAGVSGLLAPSLETKGLTLDYQQLDSHGNVIADLHAQAPTAHGSYQVTAAFPGSTDYTAATSLPAPFTIKLTPVVKVSRSSGTYNGNAFTATATVAGGIPKVDTTPAASLEGIPVTLDYQRLDSNGKVLADLQAQAPTAPGTYLVVASFAGSTDYIAARSNPLSFTIKQATPVVKVFPTSGTYNGKSFAAVAKVAGISGQPAPSLDNVTPTLDYVQINADGSRTDLGSAAPTAAGSYQVVAGFAGSTDYAAASSSPAAFTIKPATPTFGSLTSRTIPHGTASTTLTGTLSASTAGTTVVPAGVTVVITVSNGTVTLSLSTKVNADGTFSATLATGTLKAGLYTLTYSFGGTSNFNAASGKGTLKIT